MCKPNNIRCGRCETLYARHPRKLVETRGFCPSCVESQKQVWRLVRGGHE